MVIYVFFFYQYEYYNARIKEPKEEDGISNDIITDIKPKKNIRELEMKPHKNFANAPVNFKHSSVHVPTNVYDQGRFSVPFKFLMYTKYLDIYNLAKLLYCFFFQNSYFLIKIL